MRSRLLRSVGCLIGFLVLFSSNIPLARAADPSLGCAYADDDKAKQVLDIRKATKTEGTDWTCQDVSGQMSSAEGSCITSSACTGGKLCCIPGLGKVTQTGTDTGPSKTKTTPALTQIPIAACALGDGNCTLDDIVSTGVGVAKFFFGLSGAIFLGLLVFGGLKYLLAGGGSDTKKGKEVLVNAVIGLVIIFAANAVVTFIFTSLTSPTAGKPCYGENTPRPFYCRSLSGKEEATQLGCMVGKSCSGTNVFCCAIDPGTAPATTPAK